MIITIALIAFIASCAVAGIIAGAIQKKAMLEVLRTAIEKGQPLDPALVDKLMAPQPAEEKSSPTDVAVGLRVGAIMTIALAIGLPLLGWFLAAINIKYFLALRGAGALLACLAIGMLVASVVVQRSGRAARGS